MIEIPESKNLSLQIGKALTNKTITDVFNATNKHKFAFFLGDAKEYVNLLTGKKIVSTKGHGMYVDLYLDNEICLSFSEGANIRYYESSGPVPDKYQLLLIFDDNSFTTFNVAMYGAILAFKGRYDGKYYRGSIDSVSPLDSTFDENYFDNLFKNVTKDLSMKALLATEQRIPGLGNGVLQDILFNARIHPKRKKSTITDAQKTNIFQSLKTTLKQMTDLGGRDTEKDLFGNNGGYKTLLSKNTVKNPCPNCGHTIVKEAYLGGAVYYCPNCQV